MPPSARTILPARSLAAPVNAPRTWPNSSLSSRPSGSAPQARARAAGSSRARRGLITRALGTSSADPEVQREPAHPGDVYLLCSDGLSEVLELAEMAALLSLSAEDACRALVSAAYEAGSRDNISAIVVRCL